MAESVVAVILEVVRAVLFSCGGTPTILRESVCRRRQPSRPDGPDTEYSLRRCRCGTAVVAGGGRGVQLLDHCRSEQLTVRGVVREMPELVRR